MLDGKLGSGKTVASAQPSKPTRISDTMDLQAHLCRPKPVFGTDGNIMHKKPRSTPYSTAPHTPAKLPSSPNTPRTRAVSRVFTRRQDTRDAGPHPVEDPVAPECVFNDSSCVQKPDYCRAHAKSSYSHTPNFCLSVLRSPEPIL